jgi:RecJ-like exonuclease
MGNRAYWEIFVDEALPEMGITLTKEQRLELLEGIIGHASMEHEATGVAVADRNLSGAREAELNKANRDLLFEREKIMCRNCDGRGRITTYGGTFQSRSQCWECKGEGKVHPSKASRLSLGK